MPEECGKAKVPNNTPSRGENQITEGLLSGSRVGGRQVGLIHRCPSLSPPSSPSLCRVPGASWTVLLHSVYIRRPEVTPRGHSGSNIAYQDVIPSLMQPWRKQLVEGKGERDARRTRQKRGKKREGGQGKQRKAKIMRAIKEDSEVMLRRLG